ncbi:MAG TPA: type II 3-dehydroquinate dehydratase [Anaeromyxobacteraceae bacterium]|nr:type II 3-dehydroquinate dehydratase [Anaeromyxobacteraceae bacterium]
MILLVNGPNLNLLGEREPQIYGSTTLPEIERMVEEACAGYGVAVRAIQSSYEGALIDFIHEHRLEARGIIVNPGALTHSSYALHDCLKAVACPAVEVHLSNVHQREAWRRTDLIAPATRGQIVGLGPLGYYYAALWLMAELQGQLAAGGAEPEAELVPAEALPPAEPGGEYEG